MGTPQGEELNTVLFHNVRPITFSLKREGLLKMKFIKKFIPSALLKLVRPYYHGFLAKVANYYFDEPSKNMVVVGITGTAGKSTTVQMLAKMLNYADERGNTATRMNAEEEHPHPPVGHLPPGGEGGSTRCGFITTVAFSDGSNEVINKHGLSMPGGWLLHKQLKQMLQNGCKYAVVECTSEGLAQNRHLGIDFDYAVLTNLSAAHTEAHGGFENYKKAKARLFAAIGNSQTGVAKKTIVVNLDDENSNFFLPFKSQQKIGISFLGKINQLCQKIYQAVNLPQGFSLEGQNFTVNLVGEFNHYNGLLAVAVANSLGVSLPASVTALAEFKVMRGRMEAVENNRGIKIFVDYGCEPASFSAALKAANALPHKKLIHIFGSTGGHRDVSKRFIFGKTSAEFSDHIIITNDDVYDSDAEKIANDIELGIKSQELRKGQYEIILDRRQAIHRALEIAQSEDLVLITGKGSEQFLVLPGNKRIQWDEVRVVQEELRSMN